jgi:hypothetical protein
VRVCVCVCVNSYTYTHAHAQRARERERERESDRERDTCNTHIDMDARMFIPIYLHRPFVEFLLPRLLTLDGQAFSQQEWTVARDLFCDSHGVTSEDLLQLR